MAIPKILITREGVLFPYLLFLRLCKARTVVMTGTGFIIAKFRQQNTFTDEILITFAP